MTNYMDNEEVMSLSRDCDVISVPYGEKQTLNPGETVDMPVVFYVDPSITEDPTMEDVEEVVINETVVKNNSEPLIIHSKNKKVTAA